MTAGAAPLTWPPQLVPLRHTAALDEVASILRHTALNDLAGVGALVYRLRRRLDSVAREPEIAKALEAIEERIAAAPTRLNLRFMPAVELSSRSDVARTLRELVPALGVPVTLDAGPSHSAIIERQELELALTCLIENAAEAVAAAGRGTITVTGAGSPGRVTVTVTDDVMTVGAALANRLFDPAFLKSSEVPQRLHGGLDLRIARTIAHRWDGDLLVEPREPAGLTACLELPAAPAG